MAPAREALASLKRCKPARPPIYLDGDHSRSTYDDEADLWAFGDLVLQSVGTSR